MSLQTAERELETVAARQNLPYRFEKRKLLYTALGLAAFLVVNYMPPLRAATDPSGKVIELSRQGQGAIALFLLAAIWWVLEVVPIGITSVAIGVFQALFAIRPSNEAFRDFMDPAVLFIFGSLTLGLAFSKTGLTKRVAYYMLSVVGERTSRILLGSFVITAALSHVMAHTAAAATVYPIMLTVLALYGESDRPTRFGKALFIGMAASAGAGSIVTILGSARAPAAAGMFREFAGRDIGFTELTAYMFPIGWGMVLLIWVFLMAVLRPEKRTVPGLSGKVRELVRSLPPVSRQEKIVIAATVAIVVLMAMQSVVPAMKSVDRTSLMLIATLVFYVSRVLTVHDLENIPWNIILLFSGAMSVGFCLWKTGAAQWIAVKWLALFLHAPWLVFVLGVAALVLVMTNFIMNVAAIAISLPVSLVIAGYVGVAPEVVLYASLAAAGMPFLLLIGAAPNAMAYESKQFTAGQFFLVGLPLSLILLAMLALSLLVVWPLMGMPIHAPAP